MRLIGRIVSTALLLACCLAVSMIHAAEGRIPIWEPVALGVGSTPGKYVVTRDVFGAGGPTIFITGVAGALEEVDIDLNGFTLFGDPAGPGLPVIEAINLRTLTIRNGSLRNLSGTGDIIRATNVQKVVIEDVKTLDGDNGIFLESVGSFAIRRNIIANSGVNGILIDGAGLPVSMSGVVKENLVKNSIENGIVIMNNHSSVAVQDNRIDGTLNGNGIWLQFGNDCLVAENTVEEAAKQGIFLEGLRGCKIYNNVTAFNGGNGILSLADMSLFLDNVSTNNVLSGIEQFGVLGHFDRNVLSQNTCYGLHFIGPENTYGRNTARGNAGGAACGAPCGGGPIEICPAPYGGGAFPPDLCVDAPGTTSFCDNMMPGPPRS